MPEAGAAEAAPPGPAPLTGHFAGETLAGGLRHRLAPVAPLTPAVLLAVAWLLSIGADGGYYPEAWYPAADGALALLVVTSLIGRRVLPPGGAARGVLLCFAGLVAFNYLSIAWARAPGDALEASNELLLYLTVGWIVSLLPWTPRGTALLLGAFSLGIFGFCAVDLARATGAANLTSFFQADRYATPLAYTNATGCLAAMAVWPALVLSNRRELPLWLRPVLLSIAVFLVEFALLPQSRSALAAMVVTAVVVLVLAADRITLLLRFALIGAGLAVTLRRTLDVYTVVHAGGNVGPALGHAASGMLVTSLVALPVGLALGLGEKAVRARLGRRLPRPRPPGRRSALVLTLVALVALVAVAVAVAPRVDRFARSELRAGRTDASPGSTRLFSASPEERFDYWRVAADLLASSPIGGVGSGNFGVHYDALRRFPKYSRFTHDLPLRVASETGVVGLGLFLAMIAVALAGLARAARQLGALGRGCVTAGLGVVAAFFVCAALDWMDEFPALAAPAFALLIVVLVTRVPARSAPATEAHAPAARRRLAVTVGVVAAFEAAACVLVGIPYVALRYQDAATAQAGKRPQQAYADFRAAATLNPLSSSALIAEGDAAANLEQSGLARRSYAAALQREDTWYPHLQLALLDAQAGDFTGARLQLRAAERLDADDPLLPSAGALIDRHERVDPIAFDRLLRQGAGADAFRTLNVR
jgi:hypothetical protein